MNSESAETLARRPSLIRWSLGTLIILIAWLIVGAVLTGISAAIFDIEIESLAIPSELAIYEPWQAATTILISFLPLLLLPVILQRVLLKQSYRKLFTRSSNSFPGEVRIGAAVMAGILLVTALPDLIFNSDSYEWSFNLERFLPYLLVALILIPMQTTSFTEVGYSRG